MDGTFLVQEPEEALAPELVIYTPVLIKPELDLALPKVVCNVVRSNEFPVDYIVWGDDRFSFDAAGEFQYLEGCLKLELWLYDYLNPYLPDKAAEHAGRIAKEAQHYVESEPRAA